MQLLLDQLCKQSISLRQQLNLAVAQAEGGMGPNAMQMMINTPHLSATPLTKNELPTERPPIVVDGSDMPVNQPKIELVCSSLGDVETVNCDKETSACNEEVANCDATLRVDNFQGRNSVQALTSLASDGLEPTGEFGQGRYLPRGKIFHYFLSHKKHHSRMADASEHVARSLHDALEAAGYIGFFDIDDLDMIDRDSIEEGVKRSCVMLVVISDETAESEWCRFEWEIAQANDVEIKCIVDLQRFNKKEVISSVIAYPMLLKHQWTDYSDRMRRSCFVEIDRWVQKRIGNISGRMTQYSQAHVHDTIHPLFQHLLLVAGMPLRRELPSGLSIVTTWVWISRVLTLVCSGLCMARLLVAEGPAHMDSVSTSYVFLIHVVVIHSCWMSHFKLSRSILDMLLLYGQSEASVSLMRRLHRHTFVAAALGLVGAFIVAIFVNRVYLPLFLDSFYTRSQSYLAIFGWPQALMYAIVAPVTLTQAVAYLAILYVATELSVGALHVSFDDLDSNIAFMGIKEFSTCADMRISPCAGAVNSFRSNWLQATRCFSRVQIETSVSLLLHYLVHGWGLLVPCWFHFLHNPLGPHRPYEHLARIILWWVFSATVYSTVVIFPFVAGRSANDLKDIGRSLYFSNDHEHALQNSLMSGDLRWMVGPFHIGEAMLVILMLPVIISGGILIHVIHASYLS
eukprot:TRINITY_DN7372_c0_g1_i1.p1 TRINITY_DN7372_c0_g1~~TRINITY_DN7372_c0_g1_i1.p1  ORF type:complete len:753 (+),score=70.30 TRINITY_DN7372_c0_g1_i1:208-2259(+)